MHVGFIHGVMNTDNTTISGETIDYGPCAFLDRHDPATVFSSIDHGGRYAYGNQPGILQWNLARLAEALLPLIDDDRQRAIAAATTVLQGFSAAYFAAWRRGMRAKLGFSPAVDDARISSRPTDREARRCVPALLEAQRVDHTFSSAVCPPRRAATTPGAIALRGSRRFRRVGSDLARAPPEDRGRRLAAAHAMDRVNPIYIPRNQRVEPALTAATEGDLGPSTHCSKRSPVLRERPASRPTPSPWRRQRSLSHVLRDVGRRALARHAAQGLRRARHDVGSHDRGSRVLLTRLWIVHARREFSNALRSCYERRA